MVHLLGALTDLLLQHVVLLAQVVVAPLLTGVLLLDRAVGLLVCVEFGSGVLELGPIALYLVVALLELALDLIPPILYRLDLRLLALDVRLDLGHAVEQLVKGRLDLLSVPPQLLSLLAHFQVHPLKQLLLLRLLGLLLGQPGLNLGIFGLYLVAALPYIQLLLLILFDLALRLGYLGHLHLLLVIDHDVLSLQQLEVLL